MGHAGVMLSRWWSVAVVAVVLATGYAVSRAPVDRPVLPTALSVLPADTRTVSVTDWSGVRARVGNDLDAAYRADYTAVSLLARSAESMQEHYGWSVHDARWESFGQSDRGAGAVVQLDDGVDVARLRARLRDLGYDEPADAGGVWEGGSALVASTDAGLTPMLSFVAVREEARQIVLSDRRDYAERIVGVLDGRVRSIGDNDAVRSVGLRLRAAVNANVHVGRRGCELMGFADTDPSDQAAARARVEAVGGVRRYSAVGLGLVPSGEARSDLVLAMSFDEPVEGEAVARARLATGEAIGQGGTFGQRFRVTESTSRGGTVVLEMRPKERGVQLLSDLGRGAFLPAVCG